MRVANWPFTIRNAVTDQPLWTVMLDPSDEQKPDALKKAEAFHIARAGNFSLLGGDFSEMIAPGINMMHVDLARASFRQADLSNCKLDGASLIGADLSGANLTGASLVGASLCGAVLNDAKLSSTDLRGVDLSGAVMLGANLTQADLAGARLCGAACARAIFSGCEIDSASWFGADMTGAVLSEARWGDVPVNRWPVQVSGLDYNVTLLEKHIVVGSTIIPLAELVHLDDREGARIGGLRALRFLRTFRGVFSSLFECQPLVRDLPHVTR